MITKHKLKRAGFSCAALLALAVLSPSPTRASSHMDPPLITLDPSAGITSANGVMSFANAQEPFGLRVAPR